MLEVALKKGMELGQDFRRASDGEGLNTGRGNAVERDRVWFKEIACGESSGIY